MIRILILLIIACVIVSCSDELPIGDGNPFGNKERNANYEFVESFPNGVLKTITLNSNDTSGSLQNPLVIGRKIYVASRNGSVLIIEDEKLKKELKISDNEIISNICIDSLQTLYAIDSKGIIYAHSQEKGLLWKDSLPSNDKFVLYSDLLLANNSIYVASSDGILKSISLSGKENWKKQYSVPVFEHFAVNKNGDVAFVLTNNEFGKTDSLIVVNEKGEEKFRLAFNNQRLISPPTYKNSKLYIAAVSIVNETKKASTLYCIDSTGRTLLSNSYNVIIRNITVANDGNIFFSGYSSDLGIRSTGLFAVNPKGKTEWQLFFEYQIPTQLFLSKSSLAFAGTNGSELALFYLDRQSGHLTETLTLNSEFPITISPSFWNGTFIFPLSNRSGFAKLGMAE